MKIKCVNLSVSWRIEHNAETLGKVHFLAGFDFQSFQISFHSHAGQASSRKCKMLASNSIPFSHKTRHFMAHALPADFHL